MLAAWAYLAMAAATPALPGHTNDMQALQGALLELADARLRPAGLSIDRRRATLSLSGALPTTHTITVRPAWPGDVPVPLMPLAFELVPDPHALAPRGPGAAVRATLAAPLLRDVQVPVRRLRKGSVVGCADLEVQRRDIRRVPALWLDVPCVIPPGVVALRDIAAGDVLRSVDIGRPPAVSAGAPVLVSVAVRGISVTTTAVALADAQVGDQIDVRLPHPPRTLKTRVTAPGSVQLLDAPL